MRVWLQRAKRAVGSFISSKWGPRSAVQASTEYALTDPGAGTPEAFEGWKDHTVARGQDAAYRNLIRQMYAGQPRQDLVVAARAVQLIGLKDPMILEVGCGSGYYSEILPYLLQRPVRYLGVDYSPSMVHLAHIRYPDRLFMIADASALPFADGTVDIVMNGASLMHTLRYKTAISESRRAARRWCVFHTVPVLQRRETTTIRKRAYGGMVVEVIFNEGELHYLLKQLGFAVRHILDSIPYDLKAVVGEATATKTYVCEVMKS